MANKKKRNKKYKGSDAATTAPIVTKVSAVKRPPLQQWYHDHKKYRRPLIIGVLVAFGIIVIITGLISLFFGMR